jgi:hypothetical protein
LIGASCAGFGVTAHAAFLIEIDTDGSITGDFDVDPSTITFSPNFSFGGDTTSASDSVTSAAIGLTGGDSLFSGNGALQPDTYVYTYTPAVHGDNHVFAAGTALNDNGHVASGLTAGGSALYIVYATWPRTANVTGGATRYALTGGGGTVFSVDIDQNTVQDNSIGVVVPPLGGGGEWVLLGSAMLDAGTAYTLTQSVTVANSFVSMRASGVLFDVAVPEPTTLATMFVAMTLAALCGRHRRD